MLSGEPQGEFPARFQRRFKVFQLMSISDRVPIRRLHMLLGELSGSLGVSETL